MLQSPGLPRDLAIATYACDRCGFTGSVEKPFEGCPTCGEKSTLRLCYEPDEDRIRDAVARRRDRRALAALHPFHDEKRWISLGEGYTALVRLPRIGPSLGLPNLYFKNECCNPTSSFKDRYVWLTMNVARDMGYRGVVVSSTGNLGVSTAAYAASAGLDCIFVAGRSAPSGFLADAKRLGAVVVSASRARRFEIFELLADRAGWFPMGLFMPRRFQNPFGIHAYRSIAYEIVVELGSAPDLVVFPAARGNNLYGAYLGFQSLMRAGVISRMPRLVAAQPEVGNTIEISLARNLTGSVVLDSQIVSIAASAAETQASDYAIEAIRRTDGLGISVSEDQIKQSLSSLAAEGLIVDPAAALTVAALPAIVRASDRDAVCVAVLTGAGTRWNETGFAPDFVLDDDASADRGFAQEIWNHIDGGQERA
jgi:threonine synthase